MSKSGGSGGRGGGGLFRFETDEVEKGCQVEIVGEQRKKKHQEPRNNMPCYVTTSFRALKGYFLLCYLLC